VCIGLDENRVISPLEAMPGLPVPPVEMLRIAGVQALHPSREIRAHGSNDQVVVRRHENEGMASPFVARDDFI
jgi:hypothetical protein